MGYPVKGAGWTQWTASDGTPGGYVTQYSPPGTGAFAFITVRAAGHSACRRCRVSLGRGGLLSRAAAPP